MSDYQDRLAELENEVDELKQTVATLKADCGRLLRMLDVVAAHMVCYQSEVGP